MMIPVLLPEFLGGRIVSVPQPVVKFATRVTSITHSLFRKLGLLHTRRPGDDDFRSPDAGRPSPLMPISPHHLVAARGIPPSDETFLYPAD